MNKWIKKLKEAVMKDLGWKLLSLGAAIALWFIVLNIQNPMETRNFTAVLTLRNGQLVTEDSMILSNQTELTNTRVTLRVRGQRLTLDQIYQNRDEIEAYIDFGTLQLENLVGQSTSVPIQVRLPSNVSGATEILMRSPASVTLELEYRTEKEVPVHLLIDGTELEGSLSQQPELSVDTVTVSGAQSLVDTVAEVRADLTADPLEENSSYTVALTAVDSAGAEVEGVTLSQNTVNVFIPNRQSKRIQLICHTSGTPADGFVLGEVTCSPDWIYVVGEEEALAELTELDLPTVSVEGRESDVTSNFALSYLLPDGVSLLEGEEDRVTVTAEVEEETRRSMTLDASSLTYSVDLAQGYSAEVLSGSVIFEVGGPAEIVDALSAEDISGRVSISGLSAGEYSLPVNLDLPAGVRLVNNERPYVTVLVTSTQEEEPEEGPETEPSDTMDDLSDTQQESGAQDAEAQEEER